MHPVVPDDSTEIIIGWVMKIGGVFVAFVGGIISATAAVTLKMKGYDDRIGSIENAQKRCQSEVLSSIVEKLDALPDNIGDRMEKKFNRVHDRIDALVLRAHAEVPVRKDDLKLEDLFPDSKDN